MTLSRFVFVRHGHCSGSSSDDDREPLLPISRDRRGVALVFERSGQEPWRLVASHLGAARA